MSKLTRTWHQGDQDSRLGFKRRDKRFESGLGLLVLASYIISSTLFQVHNLVSRALCTTVWAQNSSYEKSFILFRMGQTFCISLLWSLAGKEELAMEQKWERGVPALELY